MRRTRILALHGCGTSSEIWRSQSQAFRDYLPPEWSLDFVEGEEECAPAENIAEIYPSPFFCYYSVPLYSSVQAAHALINEVIEEDGPFDGVMGFSQGAALAASVLLHHQDENPYAPSLFRFAIFVNGSLPYSKTSNLGVDVTRFFTEAASQESTLALTRVFTPTDDDDIVEYDDFWEHNLANSLPIRRFSPRTQKDKISIPTTHIFGKNDPYRLQSLQLSKLCDVKQANCFEHGGGHEVPRSKDQSKGIAQAIMRTFQNAEFTPV